MTTTKGQTVKAEEQVPIKSFAKAKKVERKEVEKPKQVQRETKLIETAQVEQRQ